MLLRFAFAIGCVVPALLPAQRSTIRGRVIDGSRSEPVDGAVVELQDVGGKRIGRVVTSPSGLFLLTAPAAGQYQVRVLAIGYTGGLTRAVDVPSAGLSLGDLTLMPAVRLLPDVHLVGNRKLCGAEVAQDPFVAKLLEAAKTSFEVADATIGSGRLFTVELVSVRQVTTGRRVVTRTDTTREPLARWPVESVEPDSLRVRGFVRPLAPTELRQGLTYHGPDAEVLFSPWFLESHCFQFLPSATEGGMVRLQFEPERRRGLVDIGGTIVIDPSDASLRELRFEHRNLPATIPSGSSGGSIEFGRLPGGGWLPQRWHLYGPVPQARKPLTQPKVLDLGIPPTSRRAPEPVETVSITGRVLAGGGPP